MNKQWMMAITAVLALAACGKVPVGSMDLKMSGAGNGMTGSTDGNGNVDGQARGTPISVANIPTGNTDVTGGSWTAGVTVTPPGGSGVGTSAIGVETKVELKNFTLKIKFFPAADLGTNAEPKACTGNAVFTAVTALTAAGNVQIVNGSYKITKTDGVVKEQNVDSMNKTLDQYLIMARDTDAAGKSKWGFISCITGQLMIGDKAAPAGTAVSVDDFSIKVNISAGL
jgi:hypothetical protein